jgi:acetyl esterase/lipase
MDREESNRSSLHSVTPRRAKTPAERVMPPVVYQLRGMDEVTVHPNLRYSEVDNPFLLMDIYTPPSVSKDAKFPVVVLLHGAAGPQYKPKDWGLFRSWGRLIGAAGMVAAVFTHRLGYPKPMLPEAALDVTNAIDYVRARADFFHADPGRVALIAWSGGGPLLSIAMQEEARFARCLLAFYAYLDIQGVPAYVEHETAESLRTYSPISYLVGNAGALPLFVARAGQDEIPGMNDSIDRFCAAAVAANLPLTFLNHPTGEHGFDNQNDNLRSREIIRAALNFLRTHLGVTTEI